MNEFVEALYAGAPQGLGPWSFSKAVYVLADNLTGIELAQYIYPTGSRRPQWVQWQKEWPGPLYYIDYAPSLANPGTDLDARWMIVAASSITRQESNEEFDPEDYGDDDD